MQKKRILLWSLFLLLSCIVSALPVSAAGAIDAKNAIDWQREGSVLVTLRDGDTALPGVGITLFKVADAVSRDGDLDFEFTEAFADFNGVPGELQDGETVGRLADYAAGNNIVGETLLTDGTGSVCFERLSLGLYIVVQSGKAEGYLDCSPFLVSIPSEKDNELVYDVDATPKTDIVRSVDITVKKVWNDDGNGRPESVTVQLRRGNTVVDTVTLNEGNGWSHTWTGQPKRDDWSVKEVNVPKGYIVTYQENEFAYTVTNTATLSQTGLLSWPIPVLAGAGLLLFAVGWVLYFRRKRDDRA